MCRFVAFSQHSDPRCEASGFVGREPIDLAYNAAHSAALCALRYSGYRSENRYIVFQSLEHTLGFEPAQWLLFDLAHKKRNLSEYEGELDATESFVQELIESVENLIAKVSALDPNWMQAI